MRSLADFPGWPRLSDEDIAAVVSVLRSNRLTQLSNQVVAEFEATMSHYHDGADAIAVSTGTAAVHLALRALGVGPGDEIIVPTHSFLASATPIVYEGATPVFADVTADTHCLDVASVKDLLTERTKAIIAVHINGCAADMQAIGTLAAEAGVAVIEDACQALGTRIGGKRAGTIADIGCFSFFEQKVITAGGEGGLILAKNPEHAARMRALRTHGEVPTPDGKLIWATEVGYNYRMTAMQAAVAKSQMSHVDEWITARREHSAYLSAGLAGLDGLELPVEPPGTFHAFWKYVLRVDPDRVGRSAWDVVTELRERGVPAMLRYPFPIHRQPAFAAFQASSCPTAERLSLELITLPNHPALTRADLDFMISTVRGSLGRG